ncbi:hypothetical protein HaLaN_20255, partial [Haematococcus lacustris]
RSSGLQAYFQDSVNALLSSCFDAAAAPLRPIRVLVTADYAVPASIVAQLYTAHTGISASVQSVAYSDLAFTLRQGLNMTGDTTAASSLYDLVMFSSSMMGDLGSTGALADLRPWILGDTEQVGGARCPLLAAPCLPCKLFISLPARKCWRKV